MRVWDCARDMANTRVRGKVCGDWCVRRRCSPSCVEGGMEGARGDPQQLRVKLRSAAETPASRAGRVRLQCLDPVESNECRPTSTPPPLTLLLLFLPLPLLSPPLTHQRAVLRNPTVPLVSLHSPGRPAPGTAPAASFTPTPWASTRYRCWFRIR